MKTNYSFFYCVLFILFLGFFCHCKKENRELTLKIDKEFRDKWNSLADLSENRIDRYTYDSLNLSKLNFIPSYNSADFVYDVLLNNDSTHLKVATITIINSGEILEYLISYQNNELVDTLMVYYEDNVEYNQQMYSNLSKDTIFRTCITAGDDSDNLVIISDTIQERYFVSPTLHFHKIDESLAD